MSLQIDPSKIPYEFRPEYERAVVRLCVVSLPFWERAGKYLEGDLLGTAEARLVMSTLTELVKEGGHPASGKSPLMRVIQRIQNKSTEDGRITRQEVGSCYEWLTGADHLDCEAAVADVALKVKQQYLRKVSYLGSAVLLADDKAQAVQKIRSTIDVLDGVGNAKRSQLFDALSADDMIPALRIARLPRIPFGIPPLDMLMGGGPQRGRLGFVVAHSGFGKSTMLTHHCCNAARLREPSIYFTGELLRGDQSLRTLSNLTSVPMEQIKESDEWSAEATIRYSWLVEKRIIIPPVIHPFASTVTKGTELFEIVEEYEKRQGYRFRSVYIDADEHVDYNFDFPGAEKSRKEDPGTYRGYGLLYAYLSWQAKGGQEDPSDNPDLTRVVMTASQAKGEPNTARFKLLTGEEAADSKRKIRLADWCVTVNYKFAEKGNIFFLPKGRHDKGAGNATPVMSRNFECAQMVRVDDVYPWVVDPKLWETTKRQRSLWPTQ